MTYKNSLTLVSALLLASVTTAATAQEPGAIEIRATSALAAWQKDTNRALEEGLARAPSLRGGRASEAVVRVAFDIGKDGKAVNVRALEGDYNPAAEQAALFAVRSLDTLGDAPAMSAGRPILANIILHDSPASGKRLARELARSERMRLSSADAVTNYVMIGAIPMVLDVG